MKCVVLLLILFSFCYSHQTIQLFKPEYGRTAAGEYTQLFLPSAALSKGQHLYITIKSYETRGVFDLYVHTSRNATRVDYRWKGKSEPYGSIFLIISETDPQYPPNHGPFFLSFITSRVAPYRLIAYKEGTDHIPVNFADEMFLAVAKGSYVYVKFHTGSRSKIHLKSAFVTGRHEVYCSYNKFPTSLDYHWTGRSIEIVHPEIWIHCGIYGVDDSLFRFEINS